MRPLPLLILMLNMSTVLAQDCWFKSDPFYGREHWLYGGFVQGNGTIQTLGAGFGPYRATQYSLWSPGGVVLWNKYFSQMDPSKSMWSTGMDRTTAGGASVAGLLYHGFGYSSYTNMYGSVMDGNGDPIWARYYMLDSIDYRNELFCKITQATDGGYFFAAQTNIGLSVSKLDAGGVPVWSKRYWPGHITSALDDYYSGYIIPEDNGELTLFGRKINTIYIARTDAQGAVLWKRSYPGTVGAGIETVNGDYLCAGVGGAPDYTPYLTRLDHLGNVLWHRSGLTGRLLELGNGHILVLSDGYLLSYLTELDADGSFIQGWSAPMQEWPEYAPELRFLPGDGPRGDSLAMAADGYYDGPIAPFVVSASSTASLDCFNFTPAAAITTQLEANPAEIADDTLEAIPDILKTWTMLIGPTQDANVFDPVANLNWSYQTPGYDHTIWGTIINNGSHNTGPVTATLTFDAAISFVSATPAPTSVNGQTITWQLPAIASHAERPISTVFHTPADPGLLGTYMSYTLTFSQDSTETTLLNNTVTVSAPVIGSYDPNDKSVTPKDFYHIDSDSTLEYTIRFQNTGSAAAQTVVVRDTLPTDVDTRTFELLVSSHPCTYSITGNGILTFTFNNIDLPDSNTNEPASHGLVSFRIKPILPLTLGQHITNAADIFFDFNPPIRTADATVVVDGSTSILAPIQADKLVVYPLPAKDQLTAIVPEHFDLQRVAIIGVDGRVLPMRFTRAPGDHIVINTQQLASGAYVICAYSTDGHRLAARFTKE